MADDDEIITGQPLAKRSNDRAKAHTAALPNSDFKSLSEVSNEFLMRGLSTHLKLAREGEDLSHDELLDEIYRRLQVTNG